MSPYLLFLDLPDLLLSPAQLLDVILSSDLNHKAFRVPAFYLNLIFPGKLEWLLYFSHLVLTQVLWESCLPWFQHAWQPLPHEPALLWSFHLQESSKYFLLFTHSLELMHTFYLKDWILLKLMVLFFYVFIMLLHLIKI